MKLTIRYMLKKDIHQIINIEKSCFECPWSKTKFIKYMQPYIDGERNYTISVVAEYYNKTTRQNKIVGYLYYIEHESKYIIKNVAIHESFRRQKIFTLLINKIISSAIRKQKKHITVVVRETNLNAQLAFKSIGFKAVKILKNFYCFKNCQEHAYGMKLEIINNKTLQVSL